MIDVASEVSLGVERGPGCLFIRLSDPPRGWSSQPLLAERIWAVLQQQFVYRVVVDLSDVVQVEPALLTQLLQLRRRVVQQDGVLRLCGVSPEGLEAISQAGLATRLPHFATRTAALMASRPTQPR